MRDLLILLVHLITTLARLLGPGGLRSVVAESLLVKQQLLILNGIVRLTLRSGQCRDAPSTIPLPSASLSA